MEGFGVNPVGLQHRVRQNQIPFATSENPAASLAWSSFRVPRNTTLPC